MHSLLSTRERERTIVNQRRRGGVSRRRRHFWKHRIIIIASPSKINQTKDFSAGAGSREVPRRAQTIIQACTCMYDHATTAIDWQPGSTILCHNENLQPPTGEDTYCTTSSTTGRVDTGTTTFHTPKIWRCCWLQDAAAICCSGSLVRRPSSPRPWPVFGRGEAQGRQHSLYSTMEPPRAESM